MRSTSDLPLSDLRIIDFTQVYLGPCATQMLADLGADVIKIEKPGSGDITRTIFGAESEQIINNPIYYSLNRNKRSLTLDLRDQESKNIVYQLVKTADVVVNNFRVGVMERLGFGYEKLKELNPGIIFASGTGYGSKGPYVHKGGQDVLAQAMSGVMERRSDDLIPRSIYSTALCDYAAGMHLFQGILVAIFDRQRTGKGQRVDVSLYNSMLAMQMQEAACQMSWGEEVNWGAMPLTGVFETRDGALVLVGGFNPNGLEEISQVLGLEEDLSKRFPDYESQKTNKAIIQDMMKSGFAKNTTDYWIKKLEERDLLCSKVKTLAEALEDEQTIENEMIVQNDHPIHGEIKTISSPIQFSEIPFTVHRCAPLLGEHTDEILRELEEDAINEPDNQGR